MTNIYINPSNRHTLFHAVHPAKAGCTCDMRDIHNCVICEKRLAPDRTHVDTCGETCYRSLLQLQRTESQLNSRATA